MLGIKIKQVKEMQTEETEEKKKERTEAELEVAGDGEEQQRALKRNLWVETSMK